jgi:SpoVK/Ycf46/Vps4 family AAA+-type ATPase
MWSGADLGAILSEAQLLAVHEVLEQSTSNRNAGSTDISAIATSTQTANYLSDATDLQAHANSWTSASAATLFSDGMVNGSSSKVPVTAESTTTEIIGTSTPAHAAKRSSPETSHPPLTAVVTMAHVIRALQLTRSSLPAHERSRLENIYRKFGNNRKACNGDDSAGGPNSSKRATLA